VDFDSPFGGLGAAGGVQLGILASEVLAVGVGVVVPDLPGCTSAGKTVDAAIATRSRPFGCGLRTRSRMARSFLARDR
jgi:HicB-like antitoxin of HicAB toxin-antitoxin system